MIVGVLVEITSKNIDRVFDYLVPSSLEDFISIGKRVEVPFASRTLEGFIVEVKDKSESTKLKEIIKVIDEEPILNSELLLLGKYMSDNTLASLVSCYQAMLPKALKAKKKVNINKKYDYFYKLLDKSFVPTTSPQKKIIDLFSLEEEISRDTLTSISTSSLKTLLSKGVLEEIKKEHYRLYYKENTYPKYPLTKDQQSVVDEIIKSKSNTFLIHGVTGSGKTEVYMELIEDVLNKGKTAIVLVPEISLTPQMISRFEARFGKKIAALHSSLSDGEAYDEWRRINEGDASIVIGARSAVFAPLKNLGIIIIDEEHSDSYKQDVNPRYNTKDIALKRCSLNNISLVLGSATPLLETYARASKGVYKLLVLPNRVNDKGLPKVSVIDMNNEIKTSKGHFSKVLLDKIEEKISLNEQVILLLNRRGYSSFVTCKSCGYTAKCPNCDITLTLHKTSNTLRCHYCGYGTKIISTCPECREEGMKDLGVGTEKIEEELKRFLNARVLRMDVDTTSRKGAHEKMIDSFKNHEYDILLGTQIVAKGLDFDNVTLVGIINADTSLNIPDFRSSENTFNLLSQVAGRSGRSHKTGEVILQTFNKDHYAIEYVKNHDYLGFYKKEMTIRKMLKYPPFYYLVYIKISGKDYNILASESLKIKKSLEKHLESTTILGPSAASIFKINNIYRYGITLKYKEESNLYSTLNLLIDHYKGNKDIKVDIDFNPIHF